MNPSKEQAVFCQNCNSPLEPSARFCMNCGAQVFAQPAAPSYAAPEKRKSSALKVILLVVSILIVLAIGAVVAIYYGINRAVKSSEAYKTALATLKENRAATDAIGDVRDTG